MENQRKEYRSRNLGASNAVVAGATTVAAAVTMAQPLGGPPNSQRLNPQRVRELELLGFEFGKPQRDKWAGEKWVSNDTAVH